MDFLWILTFLVLVVVVILGWLWLIVPLAAGLPYFPTSPRRIQAALKLAGVQPGETVCDLGSGDGRVLLAAASQFGARAVGIEISPVHCLLARLRVWRSGLTSQVSIRQGNFYRADLSHVDVVFAYMTSRQEPRLRPYLESHLRPGARVVTISFSFEGWQPQDFDNTNLIFLYRMPPTPGDLTSLLATKDQPTAGSPR